MLLKKGEHAQASFILNSVLNMLAVLMSEAFQKRVPIIPPAKRNSFNSLSHKYASNHDLKQMDRELISCGASWLIPSPSLLGIPGSFL